MNKTTRPVDLRDLPLVEFEDKSMDPRVVRCKHGSKHMSFNTGECRTQEVVERSDGVAYDPKSATFYQSQNFKK